MNGRFIGPYRVLSKLGGGGMGEVYLAEDERLGRRVALKSPSDAWLEGPDARTRLRREARAAARLNHPNVAAVYDVLDIEGHPYIVMEYVEGENLAAVLARGPVSVERALDIGRRITDGLAAAHASGVIHRDLKPANVMLTSGGQIKILDFGIARTTLDAETAPLTSPGQILGTPGYIAPEQLLGHPADERSDIYSAGAILYQLLSGRAHWEGIPTSARSTASLFDAVPDVASINPAVPRHLSDVIARAMDRDPNQRFQSVDAFKRALETAGAALRELPTTTEMIERRFQSRRLAIAIVSLVLVCAAGIPLARWWRAGSGTPLRPSPLPIIAVLPLENLSGDPSLRYVGAGMAETMSTKLASLSGVLVVSRSEIHDALQRNSELPKLSRALGASYLVTGGLQQAAGRLQVTINLLSADGARIVSGDIYEDTLTNVFALQRHIAEQLTRRIVGTLSAADQAQLARNPTSNVQALSAYWRGRDLLEKPGPAPIDPAIAAFEEAVHLDPGFAIGHAGLGGAYWRKYQQTREPEWARRATEAAERARQLDSTDPEVHYALATVYSGSGRSDESIAELTRVLELRSTDDRAHRKLGEIYGERGRTDQAVEQFTAALRIRDYWDTQRSLGLVLWRAGRLPEAEIAFRRVIDLQPESPFGYQLLGNVHMSLGDVKAATRHYEDAMAHGGSFATSSSLGTVYYLQGRFEDAATAYARAISARPKSGTTHWNLGDAYRHLSRHDDAAREYTTAVELFDADLTVNPKDANALAVRATCEARLGKPDRARADIARAVSLSPDDSDVQYQRALVAAILGRSDESLAALSAAVAAGYSRALLKVDQDLKSLSSSTRFQALLDGHEAPRRGR